MLGDTADSLIHYIRNLAISIKNLRLLCVVCMLKSTISLFLLR